VEDDNEEEEQEEREEVTSIRSRLYVLWIDLICFLY
jgi:hypothetical protein